MNKPSMHKQNNNGDDIAPCLTPIDTPNGEL